MAKPRLTRPRPAARPQFRPNTPPWAHVDAVQTAGLQARLLGVGAWVDRGKTDVIWDPAENKDRITQVRAARGAWLQLPLHAVCLQRAVQR